MMALYIKFRNYLDNLPLATRIAFFIFCFFIIYLFWSAAFWQENRDARQKVTDKLKTINIDIQNLQIQFKGLTAQIETKKATLAQQATSTQKVTEGAQSKIISSTEMQNVLENLLTNKYKLSLIEFQTLPAKPTAAAQATINLFEHGIVIKFKGDYFSTLNYLKAIEELKWQIFWDKLEYKVIQYPIAEITLQLHTVSDQEGWIHA